jgi:hypothetical protein
MQSVQKFRNSDNVPLASSPKRGSFAYYPPPPKKKKENNKKEKMKKKRRKTGFINETGRSPRRSKRPLWYLLTSCVLLHHILELRRLQKTQKGTLTTMNH